MPVPEAAARYGLEVGRGGKARCPFHNDTHPSMVVHEGYFYCFACHAHGDVTDLTAKLLGLSLGDAARRLITDFGLDPTAPPPPPPPPTPAQQEARCRRVLNRFAAHLRREMAKHPPQNVTDDTEAWPYQYRLDCMSLSAVSLELDMIDDPDPVESRRSVQYLIDCGAIARMEEILAEEEREDAKAEEGTLVSTRP